MTSLFERSFLMALGAAVLTKDMASSLADELVKRGETSSSEGKKMLDETVEQARIETRGIKERFDEAMLSNFNEMGLVTSHQMEELELKLAQIEHRLSLLEAAAAVESDIMPGGETPAEVSEEFHHHREEEAEVEALNPHLDTP